MPSWSFWAQKHVCGIKIDTSDTLSELQIIFWSEEYSTHWNGWWGVKYDKKINKESLSSVHVKNTTIVSFFLCVFFTLMGILIVFMSNITHKIFNQWVFAIFTCVFYSYTHVIWSPALSGHLCQISNFQGSWKNNPRKKLSKVVVDGSFSDTAHVGSGVPQGTVLGPILFLCYINDLPSSVSSDVRLFADNCLLYRPIKTRDDQKKLQEDLTKLERWADIWGMKFNPSKCSVFRVKRPRAKEIASDYQLKGVTLGQVTNSPYLGVSISEKLEWGDHISKIASKANSTLGFLRRNLKGCPSKL